jgi:hypothetical protein
MLPINQRSIITVVLLQCTVLLIYRDGFVLGCVQSSDHELIPASKMRVLPRECKVPQAEVMFITIERENIRPSKKEMKKAVTICKLPDVCR